MLSIGALAFLNPWILLGLLTLPILWRILRATPPSPRRVNFPGVRLLLGLDDPERMPDRTPWWLLLLRLSIIAAAILAFADPVLNPKRQLDGDSPVLIVMDGGWASAPDWEARRGRVLELLGQAERAGRPVALHVLAQPIPADFRLTPRRAQDWRGMVETLTPTPWAPDRAGFAAAIAGVEGMETIWLHDGLTHGEENLARALADFGPLTMIGPEGLPLALRPPAIRDGALAATAIRADDAAERPVRAAAIGRTAEGSERRLAIAEAAFEDGATEAELTFELPLELRNQVSRIALLTGASAGGVALADDAVRRKRVGLVSGESDRGAQPLISHLHYLRQALKPTAEVIEGDIAKILESAPDAMVLADVGIFTDAEREALEAWMESGGLLIRFAGPRMARGESAREFSADEDPLLPVRLRLGGRDVGGAMSWGAPQAVRPFPERSPFSGLTAPRDVSVTRQVLAQPGPDLTERTVAALSDGTPLVTMADRGQGRVVLFHVTANAEWSSLPLSGLFVQMLERLAVAASVDGTAQLTALEGALWTPVQVLDGYGRLADAGDLTGVPGARLAEHRPGPDAPPGVYQAEERSVAVNLMTAESTLTAAPPPPAGAAIEALGRTAETTLKQWLLAAALALLALDVLATLWVSGRLRLPTRAASRTPVALVLAFGLALIAAAASAQAQDDAAALAATRDTVLAYVITGDPEVDRISEAGLRGLSRVLEARTAVEPAAPIGVNLETDELAFFPLIYWPVTEQMQTPSDAAYARLNAFTRTGGMIVFDTRDAHLGAGFGSGTQEGRALRRLARKLDLPPVEPTPEDHVLTRTFYLLSEFPGRYRGGEVWVEAASNAEEIEGAPFRNLNDGVSPVVIGGHDWAGAWAVSEAGDFLLPVGRDGHRQREMAFRFGVNLVMYVLTGSYKSDQVHVPALLERLGN